MIDRRSLIASALAYLGVRVPDPVHPDTLAARFAELERRLVALERSPQLGRSSIRGGSLDVLDDGGDLVARLGDTDVGQGVAFYNASGAIIGRFGALNGAIPGSRQGFQVGPQPGTSSATTWIDVDEQGITFPFIGHSWTDVAAFRSIAAGSFTRVYSCVVELLPSVDVFFTFECSADAATTGEARIHCAGQYTTVKTLPAAAFTTCRVQWRHGVAVGGGPISFEVEVRRTSGAGNINVYQPSGLHTGRSSAATVGGLT